MELPNEIWLQILEDLRQLEVYELDKMVHVSRRFRNLVQELVTWRLQIHNLLICRGGTIQVVHSGYCQVILWRNYWNILVTGSLELRIAAKPRPICTYRADVNLQDLQIHYNGRVISLREIRIGVPSEEAGSPWIVFHWVIDDPEDNTPPGFSIVNIAVIVRTLFICRAHAVFD